MKLALVSTLVLATSAALCASAYQTLLSNKDLLACYDFTSLYSDPTSAVTDPEKYESQFLDQFCTNPSCSADVFNKAFTPVVSACGADTYGGAIADIIVRFYGPIKGASCLKNSTGGYCIIESTEKLTPYENANSVNDIPASVLCTTCNKAFVGISQAIVQQNAAYLTALGFDKSAYDAQIALISSKCGADFTTPTSLSNDNTSNYRRT
ncbi:1307_t:CDS:2 [Paraglomus occultum]|uniref:1307_t:CDS:1 n=1 Tax=Paraglomus occultum TaxID=144539 RepID=A0A9N8VYZ9_9GLOM|nr:1307_t:CDS:2 [Paraglomus occultum]